MIDAVLLFGIMNIAFEFVLLCMLPPRLRLRVLGNGGAKAFMHLSFLVLNLMIHWGTLIGTMSAILAFISSLLTVFLSIKLFGCIKDGRYYTTGLIRYTSSELA